MAKGEVEVIPPDIDSDIKIPNVFYNCFSMCTTKHLERCDCQNEEVNKSKDIIYNNIISSYDEFQLEDERLLATKKGLAQSMARKYVATECEKKNIRCSKEQKYYTQFITDYKGIYSLTDARVIMILSSLFRLFIKLNIYYKKSNDTDVLITSMSKFGESTQINPLEPIILQYEKERILCLERLDKMINGQKNINLNIDFKDEMEAAYSKRVEIEDDENER